MTIPRYVIEEIGNYSKCYWGKYCFTTCLHLADFFETKEAAEMCASFYKLSNYRVVNKEG